MQGSRCDLSPDVGGEAAPPGSPLPSRERRERFSARYQSLWAYGPLMLLGASGGRGLPPSVPPALQWASLRCYGWSFMEPLTSSLPGDVWLLSLWVSWPRTTARRLWSRWKARGRCPA
eukprot:4801914-Alexandrium_andersonii.AAC.1